MCTRAAGPGEQGSRPLCGYFLQEVSSLDLQRGTLWLCWTQGLCYVVGGVCFPHSSAGFSLSSWCFLGGGELMPGLATGISRASATGRGSRGTSVYWHWGWGAAWMQSDQGQQWPRAHSSGRREAPGEFLGCRGLEANGSTGQEQGVPTGAGEQSANLPVSHP